MNAFVRQLAVLSVLWALCELILPDGRQQQLARMTVSVLVMTSLLSTAGGLLGSAGKHPQPVLAYQAAQASQESYRRTLLSARANQAEAYCERLAQRAGYEAAAAVYLTQQGAVDHILLRLAALQALMPPEEVQKTLAEQLGIDREKIRLSIGSAEGT